MRMRTKTVMEQMNAEKPDDVLADLEAKHGRSPAPCSAAVEREKRNWWAIDYDDDVKFVTGYSCAPNSPTYWWIPQLGSSMAVGFHLFETEASALDKAIEKLERKISVAQDNIEALKRRRQNQSLLAASHPVCWDHLK